MAFKKVLPEDIAFFKTVIGEQYVLTTDDRLAPYASDATERLVFPPEIVLLPETTQQVSEILTYCNQERIPVVPRGGGTGLAGGALPIYGGVVLSLERMNQVLSVDTTNFLVTVEAGCLNYSIQQALEPFGLFYPPDPSSWQSSQIGGNIATNAGGPRAVKYGVTADYVRNLEVVLADGNTFWTGGNTIKNATGYRLTPLFVGSEGTLGVITKAVLKVLPKPTFHLSLLVPFLELEASVKAVQQILMSGLTPSTLEWMETSALQKTLDFLSETSTIFKEEHQAHLIVSFDGFSEEEVYRQLEKCIKVFDELPTDEIFIAETPAELERIWKLRRKVAEVVKANGYTIEEDTVVPISRLVDWVKTAKQMAAENGFDIVCYGHAGDGNIHLRLHHPEFENSYGNEEVQIFLKKLFKAISGFGGMITGEHGVGLIQKEFMPLVLSEQQIEVQRKLKHALDPNGILNPGKVLPEKK